MSDFHVDDKFGEELVVLFVEEGKQVPIEELTMPEIDRGIVIHKAIANLLIPKLEQEGIWGNQRARIGRCLCDDCIKKETRRVFNGLSRR